jgi:subtilisin family serine protease/uncharacterized membrane protein YozB (DUF420 family)
MELLTGPNVILALKFAVGLVSVLLAFAVWAAWRKNYRLHGRINMAFFALTMTAVVLFELVIRVIKPGIYDYLRSDPEVFPRLRVHLSFAIPSALLMPAMLWTGMKRRRIHRKLTVVFALFWILTFITGIFFLPHAAKASETSNIGPAGEMTKNVVAAPSAGIESAILRSSMARQAGFVRVIEMAYLGDALLAEFQDVASAARAGKELKSSGVARFAHPDVLLRVEGRGHAGNPIGGWSEPLLNQQWHLNVNNTLRAWDIAGSLNLVPRETIVAVLDLGFEASHPDLSAAWLVNPGEIPGNRKDDDGNGLVDDVAGWNFATNSNNLLYGASNKHGTSTAGIIGARANQVGVSGMCPWCRVLPVVVDNSAANTAAAFRYAHARGARIFSNSWGYALQSPATDVVVEAIREVARDSVIVFAMGNTRADNCRASNPDISSLEDVIAVSSVNANGYKVPDSGFGPCLDLVAPSSGGPTDRENPSITTTDRVGQPGYNTGRDTDDLPDPDYTNTFWGTSAAAPQVAGAAAILWSFAPSAGAAAVTSALISTATKTGGSDASYDFDGHSDQYGFGLVNAGDALVEILGKMPE